MIWFSFTKSKEIVNKAKIRRNERYKQVLKDVREFTHQNSELKLKNSIRKTED